MNYLYKTTCIALLTTGCSTVTYDHKHFDTTKSYYSQTVRYPKDSNEFPKHKNKIIRNIRFCYPKEDTCNYVFADNNQALITTRFVHQKWKDPDENVRIYIYQTYHQDTNGDKVINTDDTSTIYGYLPSTKKTIILLDNVDRLDDVKDNVSDKVFYMWATRNAKSYVYEFQIHTGKLIKKYHP